MREPIRVLIVCDREGNWYARRVKSVNYNRVTNEKSYVCDQPIGGRFKKSETALRAVIAARNADLAEIAALKMAAKTREKDRRNKLEKLRRRSKK